MNRLRIALKPRPRKLKSAIGLGSGPEGRIERMRNVLCKLMYAERIEGSYKYLDETRGYAELLIQQAILNGSKHEETREMANFWLKGDEDLVNKLFGPLVKRYENSIESYTNQHQLPNKYPENFQQCVIELRGNGLPSIQPEQDTSKWINNVLLESARKKYGTQTVHQAQIHDRETEHYSKISNSSDQKLKHRTKPCGDPKPIATA